MNNTWMPNLAGLLNIIAGTIGILGGLSIIVLVNVLNNTQYQTAIGDIQIDNGMLWTVFLISILFDLIAILGGVLASKRLVWGLALTGSICALLNIWSWPLGLASIVFVSFSKHEFEEVTGSRKAVT